MQWYLLLLQHVLSLYTSGSASVGIVLWDFLETCFVSLTGKHLGSTRLGPARTDYVVVRRVLQILLVSLAVERELEPQPWKLEGLSHWSTGSAWFGTVKYISQPHTTFLLIWFEPVAKSTGHTFTSFPSSSLSRLPPLSLELRSDRLG